MLLFTHAILPVLCFEKTIRQEKSTVSWTLCVAISGILPDIINPHIYLSARVASWSHTLWATVGFMGLCSVVAAIAPRFLPKGLVLAMTVAYALHLLCDAISGGVPLLGPTNHTVVGGRYFPSQLWLHLDAAMCWIAYKRMLFTKTLQAVC